MSVGAIRVLGWLKRAGGLALAAGLTACGAPEDGQSYADAAYEAMGAEAIDNMRAITVKAQIRQFDPGQTYSAANLVTEEPEVSNLTMHHVLETGMTRNEWDRPGAMGRRSYVEIFGPDAGVIEGVASNYGPPVDATPTDPPRAVMPGKWLRAVRRELQLPWFAIDMKHAPERVRQVADVTVDGVAYPAAEFESDHGLATMLYDPQTRLPARVRMREWDQHQGDSTFDLVFADWRDVGGMKVAHSQRYFLNQSPIAEVTITEVALNPTLDPAMFAIPEDLRAGAVPPAPPEETPFQWLLRRQFSGWIRQSDDQYGRLEIREVAPNVGQVVGGSHNTLLVDAGEYLVAVDAPGDDAQSRMVLDLAAQKYPGKPVRYLVLTHHHIDHSGGLRAYAASGATVVVGPGTAAFYQSVLDAPQTLNIAGPTGAITPRVVEVADKWSADGGVVEAYPIANPHADGMLIVNVPAVKLVYVTDIANPGFPMARNPELTAFVEGVERVGLQPALVAGGHGGVGPYGPIAALK